MDGGMMVGYEERQAESWNVLKERTAGGEVKGTEREKMETSNRDTQTHCAKGRKREKRDRGRNKQTSPWLSHNTS